ncbi:MAG TPA: FHA domain-containing protein, partial [Actinocrinis sp.]|nr:FHA domain-containing protein [Actinocrinis sp.]
MDANTPFTVSVLTGAHTGAVLALPSGLHVFGHDQSADVVLTDPGLASRHFTLDLAIDEVILEALSEGIVIGGKPIEREDVVILGFPVDIAIGDVRLRIEGPVPALQDEPPHPTIVGKQGASRSPTTVLAMGLFLLGACVSLYLVTGGFGQAAGAAGIDPGRAGAAAHPGQGAADAARFMTDRLTSAGLGSALTARAEEGAVRVAGTIPPDRQAAW